MVMALGIEMGRTQHGEAWEIDNGREKRRGEGRDRDRPRKFSNLRQLVCRCEVGWHASR